MKAWMVAVAVLAVLLVAAAIAAVAVFLAGAYLTPLPGGSCQRPCHISLDGPNSCVRATEPMACTMMYGLGDACLKYLECADNFGSCTTVRSSQFEQCLTCYKRCAASGVGFEGCENLCRPS